MSGAGPRPPGGDSWEGWSRARRRPRPDGALVVLSWNVAGLRGLLRRRPEVFDELARRERPDILCLQETRLQPDNVPDAARVLARAGLQGTWDCARARLGYAGVATLSRRPPDHAAVVLGELGPRAQGRAIASSWPGFRLMNVYVPNAGAELQNLSYRVERWDPALGQIARHGPLPALVAGDLNVAPEACDVYDPVRLARQRAAGFTAEERASFARQFPGHQFVDAFRRCHPRVRGYTFFSYRQGMRAKGKGWRLDHFLLSPALAGALVDCFIVDDQMGSDHVPVGLVLDAGLGARRARRPAAH